MAQDQIRKESSGLERKVPDLGTFRGNLEVFGLGLTLYGYFIDNPVSNFILRGYSNLQRKYNQSLGRDKDSPYFMEDCDE